MPEMKYQEFIEDLTARIRSLRETVNSMRGVIDRRDYKLLFENIRTAEKYAHALAKTGSLTQAAVCGFWLGQCTMRMSRVLEGARKRGVRS